LSTAAPGGSRRRTAGPHNVESMFESLRRRAAQQGTASSRLKELIAAAPPQPVTTEEWIDETEPPVARSRLPVRRLPIVLGAVVIAAVCAVLGLLLSRPEKEMPPPLPAAATTTTHDRSSATTIVVSVVGRVPTPGLLTLSEDARVADAVRAAGGASEADSASLNMARRLTDGEQLYVGIPAPPEVEIGPAAKPGKIDLNAASLSQLDGLPGVGEVTAQRIIDWRSQHGRFTAVEQLRQVDGIGDGRFAHLKDLVTVR
jgi:competence protein ComEA